VTDFLSAFRPAPVQADYALAPPRATAPPPVLVPVVPCTCCGSYTGETLSTSSQILAVSDVLVVRALEAVGKRIVRAERARYQKMGARLWHEAHTVWPPPPDDSAVSRTLASAWEIVPVLLQTHGHPGATSRQVTELLDAYVRDLLITGTAHTFAELRYRFAHNLGIS
jgi:hypothetical protein